MSTVSPAENGMRRNFALVLASAAIHVSVFASLARLPGARNSTPQTLPVRVQEIPKPVPTAALSPTAAPPPEVVEKPKPKPPVKERKPRVREEAKKPPDPAPLQEIEARGGLSNSTALPGTGKAGAPSVAEGNSAEVGVDPSKADAPPAPLAAQGSQPEADPDAVPVVEAAADVAARCPLPTLDLSEDALNAGLTSAELALQVSISSTGAVMSAVLKKGTGYQIDNIALVAARKIVCTPAQSAGKPVAVKEKKLIWKVVYE